MKVAREHLYKEVWAEPMTTVAKRYDVSSNYLARVCERLNVPRPPRGYWQQLAVGVDVEREELPSAEPGDEIEWCRDGGKPQLAAMTSKAPRTWKKGERPDKHPLLVGARAHFDRHREGYDVTYVRPHKRNLVDIVVSKALLDRALKLTSDFFLDLEDRGQRVLLAPSRGEYEHHPCDLRENGTGEAPHYVSNNRWTPGVPTIVLADDVAIGITVFEVSEEVDVEYKNGEYVRVKAAPVRANPKPANPFAPPTYDWRTSKHWLPSGRLGIHAYAARHNVKWSHYWREKTPGEIEKQYATIARELEKVAPTIASLVAAEVQREEDWQRKRQAEHEEWERKRREEARKAAEQRRREEELQREKNFEGSIARWRLARDIRDYIAETRAIVDDAHLQITAGGDLEKHLEWAAKHAEKIDPLRDLRDEVARMAAEHEAKCERCRERGGSATANEQSEPRELPSGE